jgi:hypothetical protein
MSDKTVEEVLKAIQKDLRKIVKKSINERVLNLNSDTLKEQLKKFKLDFEKGIVPRCDVHFNEENQTVEITIHDFFPLYFDTPEQECFVQKGTDMAEYWSDERCSGSGREECSSCACYDEPGER